MNCCADDNNCKASLRSDGDGWIVQIVCKCGNVVGFIHPQAALDIAGEDSEIGKQILAVFPTWKPKPVSSVTDILKKKRPA